MFKQEADFSEIGLKCVYKMQNVAIVDVVFLSRGWVWFALMETN